MALLSAFSCGTARRGLPIYEPVELDTPAVAAGERWFMRFCHSCHPGGEAGLAPALNNKPVPDFLIRWQVRWGLGAMPAFDEEVLSDEQLDGILAYLHALDDASNPASSTSSSGAPERGDALVRSTAPMR